MEIMKRAGILIGVILLLASTGGIRAAWAQDEDDYEGPMSNMHFVVVRDTSGKPVKNAAVVLHPVNKKGKQALGGMELKTDDDGRTGIEGIPYGLLRVQVLAPGFQTYGEDYEIKQPETEITVRLKRPKGQFTTYGVQEKEKAPDKDKKTDAPPDKSVPEQKPQ
jgi:hypothetical protein